MKNDILGHNTTKHNAQQYSATLNLFRLCHLAAFPYIQRNNPDLINDFSAVELET
jgi:hypothetical protein